MNTGPIVKTSFAVIILCAIVGAYLKSIHAEGSFELLMIALLATLTFIVTAIYEVNKSKRIGSSEKTRWIIGFILTGSIAGFFYLVSARNKIVAKY